MFGNAIAVLSVENGQFFINISNGCLPYFVLILSHKRRSKTKQNNGNRIKNYHKDKDGTRRGEQIEWNDEWNSCNSGRNVEEILMVCSMRLRSTFFILFNQHLKNISLVHFVKTHYYWLDERVYVDVIWYKTQKIQTNKCNVTL